MKVYEGSMSDRPQEKSILPGRKWPYSYKTSAVGPDGRRVNILHDFYVPALQRSVSYDRVAGYFRSTSLAATSQGFSAFTAAGGKMRLVVGADLKEEDVEAICAGDSRRMADRLNQQLGDPENWPEDVARGVELLAWMVAKGYLEVRVAFRVHNQTGKPLVFSATEDGYVHEKWAVFTDVEGNRLYVSGSLNESKTALVQNAENIDVHADWWGDIERRRADEAQMAFENIWSDRNPHLRVMTLPEAVKQRLVKIGQGVSAPAEIDGSTARQVQVAAPSAMEGLRFALLKDGPKLPGGRFVGMETAPVEPWPHQEVVARKLIETWPYSYLLCDEVGLGKTIEAGLAIRSLYLSGLVKRVLISPPASLTEQWQREMASKFLLPFARALTGSSVRHEYIFPLEEIRSANTLYEPDLCIVSTGLLRRKDSQHEVQTAARFDIALVDEAHYARRKNPKNGARAHPRFSDLYVTMRDHLRKRSECLWMATATPMQLDWIEVFDLLPLTRRVGPFQYDPSLTWAYYQALGSLVRGQDIHDSQWEFLRRSITSLSFHDPFLRTYLQEAVIDGRIRAVTRQWLERGRVPSGSDRRNIQRLIFATAPLSRVMLRHTRPLLEIYRKKGKLGANLAKRKILPVPRITFTSQEKRAYNELETYCKDLTSQIAAHSDGGHVPNSLGLLLSFLRLRFASSLFAIRETLRRRKERVIATSSHLKEPGSPDGDFDNLDVLGGDDEDQGEEILASLLKHRTPQDLEWERDELSKMLVTLENLSGVPSKMKELLSVLDRQRTAGGRIRQTVVFTRFYDTLQDIVRRLREIDSSMLIGTYSGKGGQYVEPKSKRLRGVEREEIKHRFLRGEIDVLVCTDAAAEGLNLQSADLLINYDLPWNPMKVEQRIGRIDRIGQKYECIYVLNLCYVDSAEQIVYDRLLKRLAQASDVVGTQQFSMLPVTFEEFIDLAAKKIGPEELEARAKERIALQCQRTASMEIPANDLYDIYMRLKEKRGPQPAPVTLESIWEAISQSKHLRDIGCTVSAKSSDKMITLSGLDIVLDGTLLTVSRSLFEEGLAAAEGRLHFASYGDQVFEAILDEFSAHELAPCICRLSERVPGRDAEVVSYAVACINEGGHPETRLITSWSELEGVQLDESAELTETDVTGLKQKLRDMVRHEFDPTRAVQRLERENERAAHAQIIMDLLAARSLLHPVGSTENDNFWTLVKDRDTLVAERERLMVTELPVTTLKKIRKELLFDFQVPHVGQTVTITAPILFVGTALDAACRIAEGMRAKKPDLTTGMVERRINREIERELKAFDSVQT